MVMGLLVDNKMDLHDFDPSLVRHDRFQFFIVLSLSYLLFLVHLLV